METTSPTTKVIGTIRGEGFAGSILSVRERLEKGAPRGAVLEISLFKDSMKIRVGKTFTIESEGKKFGSSAFQFEFNGEAIVYPNPRIHTRFGVHIRNLQPDDIQPNLSS